MTPQERAERYYLCPTCKGAWAKPGWAGKCYNARCKGGYTGNVSALAAEFESVREEALKAEPGDHLEVADAIFDAWFGKRWNEDSNLAGVWSQVAGAILNAKRAGAAAERERAAAVARSLGEPAPTQGDILAELIALQIERGK